MIVDGKNLAYSLKAKIKSEIEELEGKCPTLACIVVGNNPASLRYVNSKKKACIECGMKSITVKLPENVKVEELLEVIDSLNKNKTISGILLQLPLPERLKRYESVIINKISVEKDVDCLTFENVGKIFAGNSEISPCTAKGIIKLIDSVGYDLKGKDVVVLGRSLLVGKSVATLLEKRNATVTLCHSLTVDIQEKTKRADLVVVAIGKPNFVGVDFIKEGAFVVDVGINHIDGKLVGDVDFEKVKEKCSFITPVPGGVGPMTVACLMENNLCLYKNQLKKEALKKKDKKDNHDVFIEKSKE